MKAHCIVKTSLDMTCSVWCCSIKIWNLDCKWLSTALEVWSNRCCKYSELIFISRFNTYNWIASEHIWTDIKWCTWTIRWYPVLISSYCFSNSFYELIFWEYWHFKSSTRICHSACVHIWSENNCVTILCCVCLHTFKTWLWIL